MGYIIFIIFQIDAFLCVHIPFLRADNHSSAITLSESDYKRELMSISARSSASKLTQDPVEPPHIEGQLITNSVLVIVL